jgi:hypothetical protein
MGEGSFTRNTPQDGGTLAADIACGRRQQELTKPIVFLNDTGSLMAESHLPVSGGYV